MRGRNKLECYITLEWKCLPGTNTLDHGPFRKLQRKFIVVNTTPVA
jgi:hypothetical protein